MNRILQFQPAILMLLSMLWPGLAQGEGRIVFSENFDLLPDAESHYPPPDGRFRPLLNGLLTGWSVGGVMELAIQRGIGRPSAGRASSGGLRMKPVRWGKDTSYFAAALKPLPLGKGIGEPGMREEMERLRVRFHARVPAGVRMETYITAHLPGASDEALWKARLPVATVIGDSRYVEVDFSGADLRAATLSEFVAQFIKADSDSLVLALHWLIPNAADWPGGESVSLDEIVIDLQP